MTVYELIQRLAKYEPDKKVLLNGVIPIDGEDEELENIEIRCVTEEWEGGTKVVSLNFRES